VRSFFGIRTFPIGLGSRKIVDLTYHESEERLELYVLSRLPDSDVQQIEDHLFLCDTCRDRLEDIGSFALTIREELRTQSVPAAASLDWFSWMRPRFAVAGAFAAVVLAVGIYWMGTGPKLAPVATLQLTAMRGEIQATGAAREFDLTLTDAPAAGGPFRLEIVDASGTKVWNATPVTSAKGLEAKIATRLAPGIYFARLYGVTGQLLHEYGFRVRG
jgi:hypothetical protein